MGVAELIPRQTATLSVWLRKHTYRQVGGESLGNQREAGGGNKIKIGRKVGEKDSGGRTRAAERDDSQLETGLMQLQGNSKQEPLLAGSETPEVSSGDGGGGGREGGGILLGGGDHKFLRVT